MKKIAALALAIVLVCSLALTAFADFHPSVDGHCGHEINTVFVNGKEVDLEKFKDALVLITAEDAAEANEGLDPSNPDQMTSTGLTYAENAALVAMRDIAAKLGSVPAYIAAHKLSKEGAGLPLEIAEEALDMTSEELDEFDFVHFFILKADAAKLKEAAGLGEDEDITSLVLTYDCGHMTNSTIMLHEEDMLTDGEFDNIEVVDDEIIVHAEDVDFGVGEAKAGSYTISLDLTNGKTLHEYSLFTVVAKEK